MSLQASCVLFVAPMGYPRPPALNISKALGKNMILWWQDYMLPYVKMNFLYVNSYLHKNATFYYNRGHTRRDMCHLKKVSNEDGAIEWDSSWHWTRCVTTGLRLHVGTCKM